MLLDVNNVYVSAINRGGDGLAALHALPLDRAGQIHLAGFAVEADATGATILIDSHGAAVDAAVWALFADAIDCCGPLPTLLERDSEVPPLAVLCAEARRADDVMARVACPA